MSDLQPLAFMRIPFGVLTMLDSRGFHYALQPVHHLVRLAHIVGMSLFFGGVALLDLRLLGLGRALPFRPVAENVLPYLYGTFALSLVTGLLLFFYDPVHVGSHAYFVPKLLLLVLGVVVVGLYRRTRFGAAFAPGDTMPISARLAGVASLLLWTGVVVCSCLNTEAAPKVALY
jgi:hypothetical protein